jgi:hypothetical protein
VTFRAQPNIRMERELRGFEDPVEILVSTRRGTMYSTSSRAWEVILNELQLELHGKVLNSLVVNTSE